MQLDKTSSHEPTIIDGLNAILDELQRQRVKDDLWTADDIATYLKLKKSTVQQRILKSVGFPRPVILPTTAEGGSKRWVADEVKQWPKKNR